MAANLNLNNKSDRRLVESIARRAVDMIGPSASLIDIMMDLTAVHINGNPLRLEGLYLADDFNFAHDILGIRQHLDRSTGQLLNGFTPRYSV